MSKQTFTTGQVLTAAQMTSLQQTAMGGGSTTAKTAGYVLVAADAGTVVQMNSASATTITVNQSLFAAGDTVQIQNVGSGVCTVTAGSATVSTSATLALKQYDAGTLYFNTTSAAFFFAVDAADGMANVLTTTGDIIYSSSGTTAARLGIGSSAQVLTVASGIPSWATPASGTTLVGCAVYSASSQTIADSTWTAVTYGSEYWDTDAFHSTSVNPSRITIPAGKDGKYLLTIFGVWQTGSTGNRSLRILKNGADEPFRNYAQNNSTTLSQQASYQISLVATDYIEVYVFQANGGNLSWYGQNDASGSLFAVTYLGA